MKINILTIFPEQIEHFLKYGIPRIAQEGDFIDIKVNDLRDWSIDKHNTIDDRPYGGGAGMVMMIEPISRALEDLRGEDSTVIITTPKGKKFDQKYAKDLAFREDPHYIIICGHYEGVDQRVHEHLVDEEISMGDYILSGGEIPALAIIDAMIRLIPGVLGNENSSKEESFENGGLDYPQYTRPENFNGLMVPKVLLSGNHSEIEDWRRKKATDLTKQKRPDLENN